MRLRVIIADDHPLVRIGVRATIEASGVGLIEAEASGTDQLMELLATHSCDVLVTDFLMPGGRQTDGFIMIELIRRRYPKLPVVLLTMASNFAILRMVSAIGVLGLVDKTSSLEELPAAIEAAHRGTRFMSRGLRERIAELGEMDGDAAVSKAPSPREMEVLRLLSSGLTVTEISVQLHRSVTTISRQKGDAMRKLGLRNDAELYEFLRSTGLC